MKQKHLQHKPRYIAFVAASVDGRISLSSKHPPHWTSKEDGDFFQKSLASIDAVVVGRNTYQSVAERLRKRNTFVLSSRPKTLTRRGTVTFVNPTKVNLSKLLERYKSVAVVGGGAVYRFMLEKELLDEIFITVEPLIFGRGKEMFIGGTEMTRVSLLSVKRLNRNGTLLLHYKINHQQP
ncbi:MAG: dihydrofolate reductase family protein [Candidatus Uhrbacteria bacterium]|nr:dihydrofolate reductase family protein [Candidatus Uhrbacteria bacterium]